MNDDEDHLSPGRVFSTGGSTEQGDTARCSPACDQPPLTLPLGCVGKDELGLVGGKAVNLAALMRGNLPVPPGFCVTTAAFNQFLASCPRCPELVRTLSALSVDQPDQTANLSEHILACLGDVPIPPAVEQAVLTAWREQGEDRAYAVRSSATVEDAADHSFAGQFESCLNVRGRDALLAAIKAAWERFMSEHGHHCRGELELFNPRWSDRPDYILGWASCAAICAPSIKPIRWRTSADSPKSASN